MSALPATLPQPADTPRRLFHFYPGYSDQPVPEAPPEGARALCGHVKETASTDHVTLDHPDACPVCVRRRQREKWEHRDTASWLAGNVHGTLATLRGMCSDECPHTEIDRVLAALDDEVMDKAHVFRELRP